MLLENYSFKGCLLDFDYSTFIGDNLDAKRSVEIDKELKDITVRTSYTHSAFCFKPLYRARGTTWLSLP